MMTAPKIVLDYLTDATVAHEDDDERDELPLPLRRFFTARRRALITELRQLEAVLGMPQSIPERQRPH